MSRKVAFLPLIYVFRITPRSTIFALQVVRSLITPASLVAKRRQLICRLLHIGKKHTPRPLVWMSFTLTVIFWENMVILSLRKRLSCRHRSSKDKEESSEEGEAKQRRFGELYFSAEKHCEW